MVENATPRTLVLIPAYDERDALPGVLGDLKAVVPQFDVLVIDDGSTDGTAEVARSHGVAVARLPFNIGIGGALRTGFHYAADNGYDRAIQVDADGQHSAHELAVLVAGLDGGADLVIGSRFTKGGSATYQVGRIRRTAMVVLGALVRVLCKQRFTDTSSGFRAFSRPMVEFFARTYPVEYMESVEALLLASYGGFRVVEVPVEMEQRSAGVPSTRSLRLLYHYVRLLILMVTTARLRRVSGG